MYTLNNNFLTIEILDPEQNRNRLGSRYCTGGYIHQVIDAKLGNLLSGPQYPHPLADVFDGQGAPEIFVAALNSDSAQCGEDVLVIGVGLVTRTSVLEPFHTRNNPHVRKYCVWNIVHNVPGSLSMQTTQCIDKFEITVTRTVVLNNRTVTSATSLKNNSDASIPLNWFAHPFFPVSNNNLLHSFTTTLEMPDNIGYYIDNNGVIARKADYNWEKGLYQLITLKSNDLLSARHFHPLLGVLTVNGDFCPDALALWGNDRTCSFEPFLTRQVKPGQTYSWSITYSF